MSRSVDNVCKLETCMASRIDKVQSFLIETTHYSGAQMSFFSSNGYLWHDLITAMFL